MWQPAERFVYSRHHHFEDWLLRTQAKERRRVEDHVLERICEWHFCNACEVSRCSICRALRDLGLRQYHAHIPQILSRITGEEMPTMSAEEQDATLKMFDSASGAFDKWRELVGSRHRNFPSYGYVLGKIAELQGSTKFRLADVSPRCVDKRQRLDDIWRGICADLGWRFIPSSWGSRDIKSATDNPSGAEPAARTGSVSQRAYVGDECLICLEPMSEGNAVVYCHAGCGNSVHAACFERWAIAKGKRICVYCRSAINKP